ncbi:hypothetical protein Tco_0080839, partial [Tanacetum coccineum]
MRLHLKHLGVKTGGSASVGGDFSLVSVRYLPAELFGDYGDYLFVSYVRKKFGRNFGFPLKCDRDLIDTLHADTEDKELLISELQDSLAATENEIAILQIRVADAEDRH